MGIEDITILKEIILPAMVSYSNVIKDKVFAKPVNTKMNVLEWVLAASN